MSTVDERQAVGAFLCVHRRRQYSQVTGFDQGRYVDQPPTGPPISLPAGFLSPSVQETTSGRAASLANGRSVAGSAPPNRHHSVQVDQLKKWVNPLACFHLLVLFFSKGIAFLIVSRKNPLREILFVGPTYLPQLPSTAFLFLPDSFS